MDSFISKNEININKIVIAVNQTDQNLQLAALDFSNVLMNPKCDSQISKYFQ